MMNKTDLISNVASSANLSKADAAKAVDGVLSQIESALSNNDVVSLVGFGTFSTSDRPARKGRNPRDGSEINIPASTVVKFKAGKALRDAVN